MQFMMFGKSGLTPRRSSELSTERSPCKIKFLIYESEFRMTLFL